MRISATKATFTRLIAGAGTVCDGLRTRADAYLNRIPWPQMAKHRKLIAVALSIGLHVLLLLCLLPYSQPGFSVGGRGGTNLGEGEGLSLDLFALSRSNAEAFEIREAEPAELTQLHAPNVADPLDTMAQPALQAVDDTAQTALKLSEPDTPQAPASRPAQASAARQGGEGQSGTSSGTVDELWAAIAPCWRRIADANTLPVNLTVSFAGNGMLAKPPEIARRPEDASDFKALRSESLAITALAECGAYQMAAGRENVSISFPRP